MVVVGGSFLAQYLAREVDPLSKRNKTKNEQEKKELLRNCDGRNRWIIQRLLPLQRTYPNEYFLLAPSTTTMAAQSLASLTSSFWIELPGVARPTRTI